MVQFLVTSDQDFFKNIPKPDEQRKFFERSLAFIANRYAKNVISATVHLDEKTPHMHVNLAPIKNQKLSAESIFTRAEFCNSHTDFHRVVGQKWGLKQGESREENKRHPDTETFKLESKSVLPAIKAQVQHVSQGVPKAKLRHPVFDISAPGRA